MKTKQKLRNDWLHMADSKYWLRTVASDHYKASCTWCNTEIRANMSVLKFHAKSTKHLKCRNVKASTSRTKSISKYFAQTCFCRIFWTELTTNIEASTVTVQHCHFYCRKQEKIPISRDFEKVYRNSDLQPHAIHILRIPSRYSAI